MRGTLGWAALVAVMMGSGLAAPMAIAAGEEAATTGTAAGNETGTATGSGTGADSGSGMRGGITGGVDSASTSRGGGAGLGAPLAPSGRVSVTAIYALEAAEKAADDARGAMRRGEWGAARAYARNVAEWVGLAARAARPVGESATRWDMAAREARRLDAALLRRDEGQARWADRALTLALADARMMLAMAGGGGGAAPGAAPAARPTATPDPKSPEVRFEDVPLNRERPWTQRL